MKDRQYASINERYEHLYDVMSSQKFKNKEGLGNEVPFFICPFKPKEYEQIDKMKTQLFNKLNEMGTSVLEINLYDLAIEILKENGDFDFLIDEETNMQKDRFKEELQSNLNLETTFMEEIASIMKSSKIHIRIRLNVLNTSPNLQMDPPFSYSGMRITAAAYTVKKPKQIF